MRNNEERFNKASEINTDPPPQVAVTNPQTEDAALNFVAPTDFVELPSKGNFYPSEHPLNGQGHIEIRQMTAKDEDILTSSALLKKGIAIERLLQNLIINRSININKLLVGDKNAILIKARISAYGANYKTKVQCPVCTQYSENEFNLSDVIINNGHDAQSKDVTMNENGNFVFSLPKSEVSVEVKLLTGEDEKKLTIATEQRRKYNLPETGWTDQLKTFIVSVNDITDPAVIDRFIDNMPASDSRHLRKVYTEVVPNVDLRQNIICGQCYSESELEVPLTADFFWPN